MSIRRQISLRIRASAPPDYEILDVERDELRQLRPLAYCIDDLALVTSISRSALYEEVAKRNLTAKKFGARTIVPYDAAVEWIARLPDAVEERKATETVSGGNGVERSRGKKGAGLNPTGDVG